MKIRIFGPKTSKFGPKSAFLVILGQILPFFAHFVQCPTKTNLNKVLRWGFRYVGNKTFDFSSKNYVFLPKNDQIWPQIGIFVHIGPGLTGSLGALLVGSCGARAVSRKTTIYFIVHQLRGDNINDSMTDMVAQLPPLNIFFNSRDTLVSLFFIIFLCVAMLVSDATSISL